MIKIDAVSKQYNNRSVIEEITFSIGSGEIVALVGPNGCGKSTLIKMLAGFEKPSSGQIIFALGDNARRGVVFQNVRESLFPWHTVREHMLLGSRNIENSSESITSVLKLLGLSEQVHKYPYQLSGGLAQLTAIGRAWVQKPDVFLLDEPFSALDYYTSLVVQERFLELWQGRPTTTILVTHTIEEAVLLADRIIVFSQSPVQIVADIKVDLPKPRQTAQIGTDNFRLIQNTVMKKLSGFLYAQEN